MVSLGLRGGAGKTRRSGVGPQVASTKSADAPARDARDVEGCGVGEFSGGSMAPRITFIGGGSNQWTPMLVTDIVNTPSLHEAEIVLEDINPAPLPKMASLVEHLARLRGIPMTVRYTTDQRAALDGADYVAVTITTGGFASMRPDVVNAHRKRQHP